jgi:SET domain-containing protein
LAAPVFEIRPSPIQGFGAWAVRPIRKGTRIVEYLGERIASEEAEQRYDDDASEHPHVLLFTVDEETVIDAGVGGNEARYFNHSCAPNCETVVEKGRVFIVARRAIAPGEELTYDYQLERPGRAKAEWARRYACRCGANRCRGTMLAPRAKRKRKKQGAG